MPDKDKKVVNTEEQNRAVNPGDSATQEDSISQEPAHTVNTDSSPASTPAEPTPANAVNTTDDNDLKNTHVEGDELNLDREFAEE